MPVDSNKLRISSGAFKKLAMHFDIPSAFVFTLSRHFLPQARGSREICRPGQKPVCDYWFFLPVRVQVPCTDDQRSHSSSTAGNNQMNPRNYLHLPDTKLDIRGCPIALYFRCDVERKSTVIIAINFMDGRWAKTVEEPQSRIKEVLEQPGRQASDGAGSFASLIYLTSITRWWANALNTVNEQLIAYVGSILSG